MAVQYYERIYHTNSDDTENSVTTLDSTAEEPKKIVAIGVLSETNEGILRCYWERDNFLTLPTGSLSESGIMEYPVDLELQVGEGIEITLQNVTAGTDAVLVGYVRYEITG